MVFPRRACALEVLEYFEVASSQVIMDISKYITDIKVEGLDLMITTKTKAVSILCLRDNFYNTKAIGLGQYPSYGHVFLVNGEVQACGKVDLGFVLYPYRTTRFTSGAFEAKLLFMGKSQLKRFETDSNGLMTCSIGNEVPANVCLVICYKNAIWIKVGVLYVSEDLIFEPEPHKLNLKL